MSDEGSAESVNGGRMNSLDFVHSFSSEGVIMIGEKAAEMIASDHEVKIDEFVCGKLNLPA